MDSAGAPRRGRHGGVGVLTTLIGDARQCEQDEARGESGEASGHAFVPDSSRQKGQRHELHSCPPKSAQAWMTNAGV
jgi:hypothetical protein